MADSNLQGLTSIVGGIQNTDIVYVVRPGSPGTDYKATGLDLKALSGGVGSVTASFDGQGAPVSAGSQSFTEVPYSGTITKVLLFGDVSGSCVVDVWKTTYAAYPPTVANTITASAKPTLSSANKYSDAVLTGWTKSVTAGDILKFNIDSSSVITKLVCVVEITR